MNVSQNVEGGGASLSKVYTGVEAFAVVAVNPTLQQLNDMGIPAKEEPVYIGTNEEGVKYANIRIFLDNQDESNPIKTSVNYRITDVHPLSRTNKHLVINRYGNDAWLEEDVIGGSAPVPSNMTWYVTDDMRKAFRGERELISLIRSLRNFANVRKETPQDVKDASVSIFDVKDIQKLFKGDFSDLQKILIDPDARVTYLLGVRKDDQGRLRQNIYRNLPMKKYMAEKDIDAFNYMIKQVNESIENGAYADTFFDLEDVSLKEYVEGQESQNTEEGDGLPF